MEPDLKLEPEHGCWANIHWRVELPVETDFELLTTSVLARGFEPRCSCPMLKVLRNKEGHEIILVPRTGRTQIRISTEVAEDRRSDQARALFTELSACYLETLAASSGTARQEINRSRCA